MTPLSIYKGHLNSQIIQSLIVPLIFKAHTLSYFYVLSVCILFSQNQVTMLAQSIAAST